MSRELLCVDCGQVLSGGNDTHGPVDEPRCYHHWLKWRDKQPEASLIEIISGEREQTKTPNWYRSRRHG